MHNGLLVFTVIVSLILLCPMDRHQRLSIAGMLVLLLMGFAIALNSPLVLLYIVAPLLGSMMGSMMGSKIHTEPAPNDSPFRHDVFRDGSHQSGSRHTSVSKRKDFSKKTFSSRSSPWHQLRESDARSRFIKGYDFHAIRDRLLLKKDLTIEAIDESIEGFRAYCLLLLLDRSLGHRRIIDMPNEAVDQVWHEFLLHTESYRNFCSQAFGFFLDHIPYDNHNSTSGTAQRVTVAEAYRQHATSLRRDEDRGDDSTGMNFLYLAGLTTLMSPSVMAEENLHVEQALEEHRSKAASSSSGDAGMSMMPSSYHDTRDTDHSPTPSSCGGGSDSTSSGSSDSGGSSSCGGGGCGGGGGD